MVSRVTATSPSPSAGEVSVTNTLIAGVGVIGGPFRAMFTACSSSSTVTMPSPPESKTGHSERSRSPRAMFTPVMISSTVTVPSPLQSPVRNAAPRRNRYPCGCGTTSQTGIGVAVAVAVAVGVGGQPATCSPAALMASRQTMVGQVAKNKRLRIAEPW
jgi:hypothetical protein